MWSDSEKAFVKGDEKCKMQNGIGGQLIQLHPMDEQEPTKKFVGWEREASHDEVPKNHMPSRFRGRDYLQP